MQAAGQGLRRHIPNAPRGDGAAFGKPTTHEAAGAESAVRRRWERCRHATADSLPPPLLNFLPSQPPVLVRTRQNLKRPVGISSQSSKCSRTVSIRSSTDAGGWTWGTPAFSDQGPKPATVLLFLEPQGTNPGARRRSNWHPAVLSNKMPRTAKQSGPRTEATNARRAGDAASVATSGTTSSRFRMAYTLSRRRMPRSFSARWSRAIYQSRDCLGVHDIWHNGKAVTVNHFFQVAHFHFRRHCRALPDGQKAASLLSIKGCHSAGPSPHQFNFVSVIPSSQIISCRVPSRLITLEFTKGGRHKLEQFINDCLYPLWVKFYRGRTSNAGAKRFKNSKLVTGDENFLGILLLQPDCPGRDKTRQSLHFLWGVLR